MLIQGIFRQKLNLWKVHERVHLIKTDVTQFSGFKPFSLVNLRKVFECHLALISQYSISLPTIAMLVPVLAFKLHSHAFAMVIHFPTVCISTDYTNDDSELTCGKKKSV